MTPRRLRRRRPAGEGLKLYEVLLAGAIVVGLCGLGGCAASAPAHARAPRTRRIPPPVVAAAHVEGASPRKSDEGAAFVERSLRDSGLRFGTDGSTRALWQYLRVTHSTVSTARARQGDVVFFDTRATDADPDCDDVTDHAGVVESVEPDGRIIFLEARAGQVRRSVVDPEHPTLRRTERGEIANSFLRARRVADPPNTRYFAGQMLCGIARVDR